MIISIIPIFTRLLLLPPTQPINRNPLIRIPPIIFTAVPFFTLTLQKYIRYLLLARIKSQNFLTDGLFGSVSKTAYISKVLFFPIARAYAYFLSLTNSKKS
jgi:hypothetical protein